MKKLFLLLLLQFLFFSRSFSQIDDFLKKIPGVGDVFEEAVSTSIKDAYPSALWLNNLDKEINLQPDATFSTSLDPGYYRFRFNTFCLHAGTYAPTEGAGYLVAPLKGAKANLIKSILTKYSEHPEMDQKDVQILIWGIEANEKFTDYPADFQVRVTPLLTPEDIALMQVNPKEIAFDLLPQDVKDLLNYYSDLRGKISNVNSTYEDVEQFAVKTGIAPLGKGSKNINAGTWTSIGGGVYMRSFPEGYKKSNVEVYIPPDVNIQKDNNGNIISLDDGTSRIEFSYENSTGKFKSAMLKNLSTNEQTTIENNLSDDAGLKSGNDDFISLVKKSFGKKKSGRLEGNSLKELQQLKSLELSLNSLIDKNNWTQNGYTLSVNAVNKFVSEIENGPKKGGDNGRISGLENINGLVFAPANTSFQRLGNGGPEGGKKKKPDNCNPDVILKQIDAGYLPEPGKDLTVFVEVNNLGECKIEGIKFTLFNVSREIGRCLNDKEDGWYDTRLDFYIDPMNSDYSISGDSLSAYGSGQFLNIAIGCSDYGAFGKIKAEVKIDGVWMDAKDENSSNYYINLPADINDNKIADSWETDNKVAGETATADGDPQPADQKTNGDGMTNYEEYRGFFCSETAGGIIKHIRMNPKSKEIFVIDDGKLLSKKAWETASGIGVYYVTEHEVYGNLAGGDIDFKYRWVDFCRGYAPGNKYAINIIAAPGLNDPYGYYPWPSPALAYADPQGCKSPKDCKKVVVMKKRVEFGLNQLKDTLQYLVNLDPPSSTISFNNYTLQKTDVNSFITFLSNPSNFDLFLEYQMALSMVHEIGHACGLGHHKGAKDEWSGAEWCPMRYIDITDQIKWVSVIPSFSSKDDFNSWQFCSPPDPDNCWGNLNVNDK